MLHGSGGEALFWSIDDPPESQTHGSGAVKIYGLEIAGSDDQEAVISHVRLAIARGLRPAFAQASG